MKKNGFTLIELLGVVIILAVLALVTFPKLLNQIKKTKQGIKDSTRVLIIDAAKDYISDNINNYEKIQGLSYCIDITTLTDNNYLDEKLKDENLNDIDTTKKVKLTYHNNKFDYDITDSCTYYTVTFDANGGSVDVGSKEVIENSAYGELPTPSREGYTFMGWNGKNMLNLEVPESIPSNTNNENTNKRILELNTLVKGLAFNNYFLRNKVKYLSIAQNTIKITTSDGYGIGFPLLLDKNNKYTLSYKAEIDKNNPITSIMFYENDGALINFERTDDTGNKIKTFTVPNNTENTVVCFALGVSEANATFSNIQLEEGDTATEYEPYFVTSETKVTRNYDHTLKAIWKENG